VVGEIQTDLIGPVQTVQVVDDVSHTVSPVTISWAGYGRTTGAFGAGTYSALAIQAGPRGCLITQTQSPGSTDYRWVRPASMSNPPWLAAPTLVPVAIQYGPPATSVLYTGPWNNPGFLTPRFRIGTPGIFPDWWVPAGEILALVHPTANTSWEFNIWIQEPLA